MKRFFFTLLLSLAIGQGAVAQDSNATLNLLESLLHQSVLTGLSKSQFFDSKKPVEDFQVYLAVPNGANWNKGYNTMFIGTRNGTTTRENFLKKLGQHVESVRSLFYRKGLVGYVFLATHDNEIAFQSWTSKAAMEAAFASAEGQLIQRDAATFMTPSRFKQGTPNPFGGFINNCKKYGGGSDGSGGGCR